MHTFDFLVLGSGIAGLSYALTVADHGTVGIITKKNKADSNTNHAQGGIATVFDIHDSFDSHIKDTLNAGAGLCKYEAVKTIVEDGPDVIKELLDIGARFTSKNGNFDLGREGGHTHNRIVHAADMTGREVERALLDAASRHPNIKIFEHHFAMELITEHHLHEKKPNNEYGKNCFGAYVLNTHSDKVEHVSAKTTMLSTGGAGQVYLHTTNPGIATGDGIAMAYRAKAVIANMEFIQFHPTSLCLPGANSFLISEAIRGKGGILKNKKGTAFMKKYDKRGDLAPRDIVARAIDDQLKKSGDDCVFLDVRHLGKNTITKEFPNIYKTCIKYGLDITENLIPVVPAAHYICGGVVTDLEGQTSIQGLYASGEVASTGVHGANRLASNSLLEALVFAKRGARRAIEYAKEAKFNSSIPDWDDSGTTNTEEWILISHNKKELQQIMSDYVGIVRSNLRLKRAFRRICLLHEEIEDFYDRNRVSVPLCELRNMIAISYLIIQSAMKRKESRGLHYTTDYPEPVESENVDTLIHD
ncbi:MAG: L-aspartate oxidase [Balneolales bacterium]